MKRDFKNRWVVLRDAKGVWELPKEACAGCARALLCFTLGVPIPRDKKGRQYKQRQNEAGISIQDDVWSFLEVCERPLGMTRLGSVSEHYKHKYLWLTPFVPLRAKVQLLTEIADRALEDQKNTTLLKEAVELIHTAAEEFASQRRTAETRKLISKTLEDILQGARDNGWYKGENNANSPAAAPLGDVSASIIFIITRTFSALQRSITNSLNFSCFVSDAFTAADKFVNTRADFIACHVEQRAQINRLIVLSTQGVSWK